MGSRQVSLFGLSNVLEVLQCLHVRLNNVIEEEGGAGATSEVDAVLVLARHFLDVDLNEALILQLFFSRCSI